MVSRSAVMRLQVEYAEPRNKLAVPTDLLLLASVFPMVHPLGAWERSLSEGVNYLGTLTSMDRSCSFAGF